MNLILINDDGCTSKSSKILMEYLSKKGHFVYCFFPTKDHSATSAGIHINGKIKVQDMERGIYAVDGTPVDCLHIAVNYLKIHGIIPDMVISGINQGLNYGTTIRYSGTVASALEADLYMLQSISVSAEDSLFDKDFRIMMSIIHFIVKYIEMNPINRCININFFGSRYTNMRDINIEFENEVADYRFILPKLEFEQDNDGKIFSSIITCNNKSREYKAGCLMIGLISRNLGLYYNKQNEKWMRQLIENIYAFLLKKERVEEII